MEARKHEGKELCYRKHETSCCAHLSGTSEMLHERFPHITKNGSQEPNLG